MSRNRTLGIGALSQETGVAPETIRYYEAEGLLSAPERSVGGHRRYRREHLRQLCFIVRARDLGFSQPEVRALLELSGRPEAPCEEVQRLAAEHLADVRARIRDLRRMERTLAGMVSRCQREGTPGACPIIETLAED